MQDYDTIEGDAGPCKYRVSLSIGRTKKINTYGMAGQKLKTSTDTLQAKEVTESQNIHSFRCNESPLFSDDAPLYEPGQ